MKPEVVVVFGGMIAIFAFLTVLAFLLAGRAFRSARSPLVSTEPITALRLVLQRTTVDQDALVQPLLAADPQFVLRRFLEKATEIFIEAVSSGAAQTVPSSLLTAAMAQRLSDQRARWESDGFRVVVKDIHVDDTRIIGVNVAAGTQRAIVGLRGRWIHYVGAPDSNAILDGVSTPVVFSQNATFVRTLLDSTACASCGAQVAAANAQCPYCGAKLDPVEAEWLLDELSDGVASAPNGRNARRPATTAFGVLLAATQPGALTPAIFALGKNLQAATLQLQRRDPNFSQERFLRWASATYADQRLRDRGEAVAVQQADIVTVYVDDQREMIVVAFRALASGGTHLREAAIFSRPPGEQTPALSPAAGARCSNCGAPLGTNDTTCRFCGNAVADTHGLWKMEFVRG